MDVRDQREPGWLWIDNEIIDQYGAKLGANGIAVYTTLARFAGQNGHCTPSINTLCKRLKLSRPTVIKALRCLEECGLILADHRKTSDGDPDSNVYTMLRVKAGGKEDLLPSKPDLPPSKADSPQVVKDVDGGSKGGLLKEDVSKKTYERKHGDTPPPANPTFELASALSEVCCMDLEANKGQLLKEAKTLSKATPTPTPDEVRSHYSGENAWWWLHDWRGQKGDFPKPANVRETWGQWTHAAPKVDPVKSARGQNGHTKLSPALEALRRAQEQDEQEQAANGY